MDHRRVQNPAEAAQTPPRQAWVAVLALWVGLVGCEAAPDVRLAYDLARGDPGPARVALQQRVSRSQAAKSDKDYLLNRMRLVLAALADGYPQAAAGPAGQLFELLTTQGLNKDKALGAFVFHEGVRIWKGEPFEQALGFHYLAVLSGMQGSWDNARAASLNAIAPLRDYRGKGDGIDRDMQALLAYERGQPAPSASGEFGYAVEPTDFTLGLLMLGLANQRLGVEMGDGARINEASDHYNRAIELDGNLRPLVERLAGGRYNAVLLVDAGIGPRKVATGTDGTETAFVPQDQSDGNMLAVSAGTATERWPVVCDVNRMAQNHLWRGLEGARQLKSALGTGLMIGGGTAAVVSRDRTTQLVGVGLIALGALMKGTASADTRYCEAMPQRVYLAPLWINTGDRVGVQVEGRASSRLVLAGLTDPGPNRVALHYVRLPSGVGVGGSWTTSGQVWYVSDATPLTNVSGRAAWVPYILGGADVRLPTQELLGEYRRQGGLPVDLTLGQLEDLYRAEGISLGADQRDGPIGRHVLEGGTSMVPPVAGSTGFARLFGQQHPPYRARSAAVAQWQQQLSGNPTTR